jgi:hypothetical protein
MTRKGMTDWMTWATVTSLAVALLTVVGCLEDGRAPGGVEVSAVECAPDGSCPTEESCLDGYCVPACGADADCPAGAACVDGLCDVAAEPWACGADADCPAGAACADGVCVAASGCAPAPEICNGLDDDCDGAVDEGIDFTTDPASCGGCGMACAAGEACLDGVCVAATACASDADCDDGLFCNSAEVCMDGECIALPDILCDDGDPATTDSCDESTDSCSHSAGGCTPAPEICNGLDDDCDGLVDDIDLLTDPANCGACGMACPAGERCEDGVCRA